MLTLNFHDEKKEFFQKKRRVEILAKTEVLDF